jgi:hypothetical protein
MPTAAARRWIMASAFPEMDWIYPIYDHGWAVYGTRFDQALADGMVPAVLMTTGRTVGALGRHR